MKSMLWMAAGASVLAAFFFSSSMHHMEPKLMSNDEIWSMVEKAERIPEDEFDAFYDLVVAYLKTKGSFSEGGLDDNSFSSSRWVDPLPTLTVVSNVPITLSLAEGLHDEMQKLKRPHAVIFDGIDGTSCVTSDGRFLRDKQINSFE
ncbi:MAG: hypothetical protein U1F71_07405 [Verrucomicrobiaceae bacterium]